jgi:hypothetical protein
VGTAYKGSGNTVFNAKIGLIAAANTKYTRKETTTNTLTDLSSTTNTDRDYVKDGLGYDASANLRADLFSTVASLQVKAIGVAFKSGNNLEYERTTSAFKAVAGIAPVYGRDFKLPLEVFYELFTFTDYEKATKEYSIDYSAIWESGSERK